MTSVHEILSGFPARSSRGYLGWSSSFLVENARGKTVLFDTGGCNERGKLPALLEGNGASLSAVDAVVLSHFHFDHAANWDLFPRARIYLHELEMEYISSAKSSEDAAVLRYHVEALEASKRLELVEQDVEIEEGIRLLHAPGHTPGSIIVACDEHVLCGDALKNRWDLSGRGVSAPVWDPEEAQRTIARIATLGDVLHPGHDAALTRVRKEWKPVKEPQMTIRYPDGNEVRLCPCS
ncbi:MAG: MBL fold metallo-hydrolase [Arenicellales bacterium]